MKRIFAVFITLALVLALLPVSALADVPTVPTGKDITYDTSTFKCFFANGIPITIQATEPAYPAVSTTPVGFNASGNDAYIVWEDSNGTKYCGVNKSVLVFGGADGSAGPESVASTDVKMTGGTIWRLYAGNYGEPNTLSGQITKTPSAVTGNAKIDVTGGVVTDYIAAGWLNSAVNGTVTIDVSNMTAPSC